MEVGLEVGTVRLEPHNPIWEELAKEMIVTLHKILGEDAKDIQHVGSTAIKTIKAKPIVDLAVAVENLDIALKHKDELEKNGIHYVGEINKGQVMCDIGNYDANVRTHHVHFVIANSTEWKEYLNMRDYLNAKPEIAAEYAHIKEMSAVKYGNDRKEYSKAKNDIIKRILKEAEEWRKTEA